MRDMTDDAELAEAFQAERREMREAMLVVPASPDNSPDGKRVRAPSVRGKRGGGGLLDEEEAPGEAVQAVPPQRTAVTPAASSDNSGHSSGELAAARAEAAPAVNDGADLSA